MLLALLYDQDHRIRGAALACEQQPYGDRFWSDEYLGDVPWQDGGFETAYVEIVDSDLTSTLLAMQYDDGQLDGRAAADAVEAHLKRQSIAAPRHSPRAA